MGVILVVGIVSNILQTVTQIRDQAISFVPKVIAVGVTVVLCIPWFFAVLSKYVHLVFSLFEQVTQ
ncbi:MAG: flagellar biosynthetic protein FliQ [Lentisphaerae bacterium]|nr:MAG: flagellar biosynthetic protein FliQ [Lentisphaerota bacterium]